MRVAAALGLVALLLPAQSEVSFEKTGVRVDGRLVTGDRLELIGNILVSREAVTPLGRMTKIQVARGRSLVLSPGMRIARERTGFKLENYRGSEVILVAGGRSYSISSPTHVEVTAAGWQFGDQLQISEQTLTARRTRPGRLRIPGRRGGPSPDGRPAPGSKEPLYDEMPWVQAGQVDSHAIRRLPHISPAGF